MMCNIKSLDLEKFYGSNHRTALKLLRYINVPLSAFCLIFFLAFLEAYFFLFLSYWGILLTFIYFLLVSLSYQSNFLKLVSCIIFETIWAVNIGISLLYWFYLFPQTSDSPYVGQNTYAHTYPIIVTITDYALSDVVIYRKHYIFPIGFLLLYTLTILLPYSLAVDKIYPGITFKNVFSYIIFLVFLAVIVISLEIGRYIRVRICCSQSNVKNGKQYEINEASELGDLK